MIIKVTGSAAPTPITLVVSSSTQPSVNVSVPQFVTFANRSDKANYADVALFAITTAGVVDVASSSLFSDSSSFANTASYAILASTASYAINVTTPDFNTLANKPTLVSSSAQINTGSFSGLFNGSLIGSASYALTASYVLNGGAIVTGSSDFNTLINKPSLVSSSAQVNYNLIQNIPSASNNTASYVDYSNVANKPIGLISSSVQASQWSVLSSSYASTASYAANASAADFNTLLNKPVLVSSSAQISYLAVTNIPIGIISSSAQLNLLVHSSSYAATASYALNVSGGDFNTLLNKPTLVSSSAQVNTGSFTGSFVGSHTGSLLGSASFATTASAATSITFTPISSSYAVTASYAANVNAADFNTLLNKPSLVSSSAQINSGSFSGSFNGSHTGSLLGTSSFSSTASVSISGSYSLTASYAITTGGTISNAISSSYAVSASWAPSSAGGDFNTLVNKPTLVSSSAQINSGSFTGSFTGSLLGSSSYAPTILPLGVVSSSAQVSYTGLINIPVGILSSSTQFNVLSNTSASYALTASYAANASAADFNTLLNKPTLVSSSAQITYGSITGVPSGIISSSAQVVANLPIGTVSSSAQINTGSFTGSFIGSHTGSFTGSFVGSLIGSSSFATTASAATSITFTPVSATYAATDFNAINNKPALVSASAQVSYTGLSNIPVGILSSSTQFNALANTSASYALTASYASNVTAADFNTLTNKPTLVSSSTQVNTGSFTGSFVGTASYASNSLSASYAPTILPVGTVSSSGQITYGSISNLPVGILSSSTQFNLLTDTSASYAVTAAFALTNAGTVTSAATASYLSGTISFPNGLTVTGSVTASAFSGSGTQIIGIISSSYALSASWAPSAGGSSDFNTLTNKPTLVSSSTQVNTGSFTGSFIGSHTGSFTGSFIGALIGSASFATTASAATSITFTPVSATYAGTDFNAINNKPALVSSSAQISYGSITGVPVGIISSSAQVTANLPVGTVSSSVQITYGSITGVPSGIVSSSVQVVANLPVGTVSSSVQINTGSFTGSFTGVLVGSASFSTTASAATSITFTPVSATYAGTDFGAINNKPSLVSASAQISYTSIVNVPVGILSSSTQFNALTNTSASWALTASYAANGGGSGPADFNTLTNKPTLVSASAQINTGSFTGSFAGMNTGFFSGSSVTSSKGAALYSASVMQEEATGSIPLAGTMLQVIASSSMPTRVSIDTHNNNNTFGSSIRARRSRGTVTNPTAILKDDVLMQIVGDGYDGTTYQTNQVNISLFAYENWSNTNRGSYINLRTTPSGSTTSNVILTAYGDSVQVSSSLYVTGSIIANSPISASAFSGSGTQITGVISSSYALSASWSPSAAGGDFNTLINKPTLVSSSAQVNSGSFTGSFIGSASFATNAVSSSYMSGTISFPTGLVVTGSVTASAYTGSFIGPLTGSITGSATITAQQTNAPISGTFGRSSLFVPGLINATSLTTIVTTVSTIRIWPFIAPGVGTGSVKALSLLATANGTIAVTASVAIYTNKPGDLYPNSLVTASSITIPTNALQTVILPTPVTLVAGQLYWIGFNIGSGSTLRGTAVAAQYPMGVTALGTAVDTHYSSGSIWGTGASFVPAWPASLTGSNLTVGTNATILPSIGLAFQ